MEDNLPIMQDSAASPSIAIDAAAYVEQFLKEADIAPSTKVTYRKSLKQFFLWRESHNIQDLSRIDILSYKQEQLSKNQATTASAYLAAVKSFFRWLEAEKIYPNVAAGVKGAKLSQAHRKDALTPAQARHVLETLKGDSLLAKRDFAIFNLLLHTGLRTVELHRADVSDMRNKGAQSVLYVQGKGRMAKDDFVVLTESALRPMYEYMAARRAAGREVVTPDAPLFASLSNKTYGNRLSIRSLRQIVKAALRRAGYDDDRLTTHSLRHTAVTFALLGGASIQQAQAMARHTSVNTTLLYSHNLDRLSQSGEAVVADILAGADADASY